MTIAIPTQTVDDAGKIGVSDTARQELGLVPGARLVEAVVQGMLVYIPASAEALQAFDDFVRVVAERGVTVDDLLADLEREKDATFAAFYPDEQ